MIILAIFSLRNAFSPHSLPIYISRTNLNGCFTYLTIHFTSVPFNNCDFIIGEIICQSWIGLDTMFEFQNPNIVKSSLTALKRAPAKSKNNPKRQITNNEPQQPSHSHAVLGSIVPPPQTPVPNYSVLTPFHPSQSNTLSTSVQQQSTTQQLPSHMSLPKSSTNIVITTNVDPQCFASSFVKPEVRPKPPFSFHREPTQLRLKIPPLANVNDQGKRQADETDENVSKKPRTIKEEENNQNKSTNPSAIDELIEKMGFDF